MMRIIHYHHRHHFSWQSPASNIQAWACHTHTTTKYFALVRFFFQTTEMAAEIESSHGEKPVYRKMAEYKKKIALVEVLFANYLCAFKTSYPGNLYKDNNNAE